MGEECFLQLQLHTLVSLGSVFTKGLALTDHFLFILSGYLRTAILADTIKYPITRSCQEHNDNRT